MLKNYYLQHEGTGKMVMVGYKVDDAASLEAMGYRLARSSEEDFSKARKRGTVYIKKEMYDDKESTAFLYNNKGLLIGYAHKLKNEGVK